MTILHARLLSLTHCRLSLKPLTCEAARAGHRQRRAAARVSGAPSGQAHSAGGTPSCASVRAPSPPAPYAQNTEHTHASAIVVFECGELLTLMGVVGKAVVYRHSRMLIDAPKPGPEVSAAEWCSPSRRREFCHFDDTPCLSLLKHLIKVQGGCHQMTVSPTAMPTERDLPDHDVGQHVDQPRHVPVPLLAVPELAALPRAPRVH